MKDIREATAMTDELSIRADLPEDATLLIVDDDEAFRTRLARAMEKRGFETTMASGVKEAIRLAKEAPPAFAVV
ncbi:MAG TPA: two-component system response regulator, partial [Parvularcula sp.]|nr:two-component system response regulator [Parvularcula sp.]